MAYINGEQIMSIQMTGLVNIDTEMSDVSENPVQNKVVKSYVDNQVQEVATATGANLKWQLIEAVTNADADTVTVKIGDFTADDCVKGIFIRFKCPAVDISRNIYLRLYDSNDNERIVIGTSGYLSTTAATFGKIKCELDKGLWDGWWESATNNDTGVWTSRNGIRFGCSAVTETEMPYIKYVTVGVTGANTLPVGAEIEVWGLYSNA